MLGGIRPAGVRPGFTAVLESRGTAVRSDRASGNGWAPGSATVPDEFPGRIPWPNSLAEFPGQSAPGKA